VDQRHRPVVADGAGDATVALEATTPPPFRIDGRRLRSERTKQLIIEAYLALAAERAPHLPTAAAIAGRAGYSVRSVFERFHDLQALQLAAIDYALVQAVALSPSSGRDGDRRDRISAQVEGRAQICERWMPVWNALLAHRGESPEFRRRIEAARARNLSRLEATYAPELEPLAEADRRQVLIILEALTDVDSWARMREFFGLSVDDSRALWREAINRLLPETPAAA
jgi:AcrR family transcriptional regulator